MLTVSHPRASFGDAVYERYGAVMDAEGRNAGLASSESVNALEVLYNVAYLLRADVDRPEQLLRHIEIMERALATLVRTAQES